MHADIFVFSHPGKILYLLSLANCWRILRTWNVRRAGESLMLLQISLASQGKSRQNSWSFIPISWADVFNTPWRKGLILKIFLFLDAMHSIRIERNDSFDHLSGCLSFAMNFSNVAVTCIPSLFAFPHLVSSINFMESRMSVLYPPYICLYTM